MVAVPVFPLEPQGRARGALVPHVRLRSVVQRGPGHGDARDQGDQADGGGAL